jgi:hypothetical protein
VRDLFIQRGAKLAIVYRLFLLMAGAHWSSSRSPEDFR